MAQALLSYTEVPPFASNIAPANNNDPNSLFDDKQSSRKKGNYFKPPPSDKTAVIPFNQVENRQIPGTEDIDEVNAAPSPSRLMSCLEADACFLITTMFVICLQAGIVGVYQEFTKNQESIVYDIGLFALIFGSLLACDLALAYLSKLKEVSWRKKMCIAVGIDLFAGALITVAERLTDQGWLYYTLNPVIGSLKAGGKIWFYMSKERFNKQTNETDESKSPKSPLLRDDNPQNDSYNSASDNNLLNSLSNSLVEMHRGSLDSGVFLNNNNGDSERRASKSKRKSNKYKHFIRSSVNKKPSFSTIEKNKTVSTSSLLNIKRRLKKEKDGYDAEEGSTTDKSTISMHLRSDSEEKNIAGDNLNNDNWPVQSKYQFGGVNGSNHVKGGSGQQQSSLALSTTKNLNIPLASSHSPRYGTNDSIHFKFNSPEQQKQEELEVMSNDPVIASNAGYSGHIQHPHAKDGHHVEKMYDSSRHPGDRTIKGNKSRLENQQAWYKQYNLQGIVDIILRLFKRRQSNISTTQPEPSEVQSPNIAKRDHTIEMTQLKQHPVGIKMEKTPFSSQLLVKQVQQKWQCTEQEAIDIVYNAYEEVKEVEEQLSIKMGKAWITLDLDTRDDLTKNQIDFNNAFKLQELEKETQLLKNDALDKKKEIEKEKTRQMQIKQCNDKINLYDSWLNTNKIDFTKHQQLVAPYQKILANLNKNSDNDNYV